MVYGKGSENFRGFLHHVDTSKETAKLMLFGNTNKYIKNYGVSSLKGDANGDFVINKDDAYVTLMSYVGEEVDTQNEEKLDMDNNGLIDYMDVAIIMNKAESY
jgi:alkaline phosphatase